MSSVAIVAVGTFLFMAEFALRLWILRIAEPVGQLVSFLSVTDHWHPTPTT